MDPGAGRRRRQAPARRASGRSCRAPAGVRCRAFRDSGLTAAMSELHPKAVSQRPHEGVPQVDQYAIEHRQARLWRAARRWTGILSVLAGLLAGASLLFGGAALAAPVAAGATPAPAPAATSGPATAPPASSYAGGDRGFAARGADGSVYFSEGPGIGGSWTQMPGRR